VHYGQGPSCRGYWQAWLAHQRWLTGQLAHLLAREARKAVRQWLPTQKLKR
jgi:hypothetical protein